MFTKVLTILFMILATNYVYGGIKMSKDKLPKISVRIAIQAIPGREEELAKLLAGAASVVSETEPKTIYWYANRLDKMTFTINDGFVDEAGVKAHFSGKVATLLKSKAGELVLGGWEQGVLPNIEKAEILSSIK